MDIADAVRTVEQAFHSPAKTWPGYRTLNSDRPKSDHFSKLGLGKNRYFIQVQLDLVHNPLIPIGHKGSLTSVGWLFDSQRFCR